MSDELNARYDPMTRDELIAECERLRAAMYQACSDMGCYCADDDPLPENLKCPICKLEEALHGVRFHKEA